MTNTHLSIPDMKVSIARMTDYQLNSLWNWLNPMNFMAEKVIPNIYIIKANVHREIMGRTGKAETEITEVE